MRRSFERFKKIITETENILHRNPGTKRFDAFKRAVAKIKFFESQDYDQNGEIVNDLIGNHNHNDWTY